MLHSNLAKGFSLKCCCCCTEEFGGPELFRGSVRKFGRQTHKVVIGGLDLKMSKACLKLSPDNLCPAALIKISPSWNCPDSQAGWEGNIRLTRIKFVNGGGASGPPVKKKCINNVHVFYQLLSRIYPEFITTVKILKIIWSDFFKKMDF